jgi:hypothetical protein
MSVRRRQEKAGGFVAISTAGTVVGRFASLRQAARAFPTGGER